VIAELPRVSRFEADLLTILQGFLGHAPRSQLLSLLASPCERPLCLSRAAVELVQDTLAKGATRLTAEAGWQRERFLCDGTLAEGRVWQRLPPDKLGLGFSPQSLAFLLWATAAECLSPEDSWKPLAKPKLTMGDRWLLTTAYAAVRGSDVGRLWAQREPWRGDALCQLMFAADFDLPAKAAALDFDPWLRPAGLAVLESEQSRLARLWAEMEREKSRVTSPQKLQAMAASQARVLDAFLTAIDKAGRRDLARFLLAAVADVLRGKPTLQSWLGQVQFGEMRLADRQTTYRAALVVLQEFQRLAAWQAEARGVGYFDDQYQAAQLWKSDWEAYNGDSLANVARGLLDQSQWI
jgi:hypothetical protein